jgi:hypothetical protein
LQELTAGDPEMFEWRSRPSRPVVAVVLEFLKDIRRRYPAEVTVYIVMDNLSAHWTPEIRRWAVNNNVGLLPTPTNARHLKRIECHFWAFVEFVIKGSDYADWTEFTKAAHAYIRRRNRDRHDPPSSSSRTAERSPDSYRRIDPRRPTSTDRTVSVEVRGDAPQLDPGFSWSVTARAEAPVERFVPEPDR